jgi:hypothetical protein
MSGREDEAPKSWGTYRHLYEMIEDLATTKGFHTDKRLSEAIEVATGYYVLEKNIQNWRSGRNVPSPEMLDRLAATFGIIQGTREFATWNRLYADATAVRRAKRKSARPLPIPPETGRDPDKTLTPDEDKSPPVVAVKVLDDDATVPVTFDNRNTPVAPLATKSLWKSTPRHVRFAVIAACGAGALALLGWQIVGSASQAVTPPRPPLPAVPTAEASDQIPLKYVDTIPPWELRVTKEGFMFPDSGRRVLTRADLVGLTGWELYIARNEIWARHGRTFERPYSMCVQNHFNAWARGGKNPRGWYVPVSGQIEPSALERRNARTIQDYECDERGGQFLCHGKPWICGTKRPD